MDETIESYYIYWAVFCMFGGVLASLTGEPGGIICFLGGVLLWGMRDLLYPAR
jgi:hypothetical protein